MSLAIVYSRAQQGIQAPLITVEVHIANGLPAFSIVGLPETTVRESRERVRSALLNSHFDFPLRRITVNLAPADLPKEGGRFDLPIAIGVLLASKQLKILDVDQYEFLGELALDGSIRRIKGILPAALEARKQNHILVCPQDNKDEASLLKNASISCSDHILRLCKHFSEQQALPLLKLNQLKSRTPAYSDLSDIYGQQQAKRALEVAAAGEHSLLMIGPPGTGKTMLATRLPGILPVMSEQEALESAAVISISKQDFDLSCWSKRPFRAPHHTASAAALVGGTANPRPGEVSLAHCGVMFLDELPEFKRQVLEVLREPLESGVITISRALHQAEFPARFQLIAAMNPCPCGYLGDSDHGCRCSPDQVRNYRNRVSGPLLDRFDMQLEVTRPNPLLLMQHNIQATEQSLIVRERVQVAHDIQLSRNGCANARLQNRQLDTICKLPDRAQSILIESMDKMKLSARAAHRIIKLARTIADLSQCEHINSDHLSEALTFRRSIHISTHPQQKAY
ncbi:AAA+ ATPase superfamily protein YifB/ComM, associated with DNA recombination [hydrothermal vent metagenome]|uniref:AAA+ ATPase superfamily protein YifB/ComM, associated with DNA recombination n=1 Tax=hydrothermal vent metagenome TaxID=652676 RepID=A0A3B0Z2V7_9ZZZZ